MQICNKVFLKKEFNKLQCNQTILFQLVQFRGIHLLVHRYFYFFALNRHYAHCQVQYGYKKYGTHAQIFFKTLTYWHSKNEIRQRNRRRAKEERHGCTSMKRSTPGMKNKRSPDSLPPPNQNTIKINIILQYFIRNVKNT